MVKAMLWILGGLVGVKVATNVYYARNPPTPVQPGEGTGTSTQTYGSGEFSTRRRY